MSVEAFHRFERFAEDQAELVEARDLIVRQDDRIAGLLKLLAEERAKTAVVLDPLSARVTLTAVEIERIKADWLAADHLAVPVVLPSAGPDPGLIGRARALTHR
jgi:hypothetical protein